MIRVLSRIVAIATVAVTFGACERSSENATVTTTAPNGQSTTAPAAAAAERADNALVRLVHAVPGGANIDVSADGARAFENVAYKSVTPYVALDGQRYAFEMRPAGMPQSQPLASNREGLDDGEYYTIFAVPGDDDAASLRIVEDDFSYPASGKARVRVVHASRDLGELDVFASGRDNELFDGVDFQSVTDYDEIDPWSGALEVRAENERTTLLMIPDVTLQAGKVYTVVISGTVRGKPRLEGFVIEDQLGKTAANR